MVDWRIGLYSRISLVNGNRSQDRSISANSLARQALIARLIRRYLTCASPPETSRTRKNPASWTPKNCISRSDRRNTPDRGGYVSLRNSRIRATPAKPPSSTTISARFGRRSLSSPSSGMKPNLERWRSATGPNVATPVPPVLSSGSTVSRWSLATPGCDMLSSRRRRTSRRSSNVTCTPLSSSTG